MFLAPFSTVECAVETLGSGIVSGVVAFICHQRHVMTYGASPPHRVWCVKLHAIWTAAVVIPTALGAVAERSKDFLYAARVSVGHDV